MLEIFVSQRAEDVKAQQRWPEQTCKADLHKTARQQSAAQDSSPADTKPGAFLPMAVLQWA